MCPMPLSCKLSKVMHSRDKVQLTGMHYCQGLDGSLGNSSNEDSFDLREEEST